MFITAILLKYLFAAALLSVGQVCGSLISAWTASWAGRRTTVRISCIPGEVTFKL